MGRDVWQADKGGVDQRDLLLQRREVPAVAGGETGSVADDRSATAAEVDEAAREGGRHRDAVARPDEQGHPVHVAQANPWQQKAAIATGAEIGRAEKRDRKGEVRRERQLGCAQDEVDLPVQIGDAAAAGVEHDAVEEQNAMLEAGTDHVELQERPVLFLAVGVKLGRVERLDP